MSEDEKIVSKLVYYAKNLSCSNATVVMELKKTLQEDDLEGRIYRTYMDYFCHYFNISFDGSEPKHSRLSRFDLWLSNILGINPNKVTRENSMYFHKNKKITKQQTDIPIAESPSDMEERT